MMLDPEANILEIGIYLDNRPSSNDTFVSLRSGGFSFAVVSNTSKDDSPVPSCLQFVPLGPGAPPETLSSASTEVDSGNDSPRETQIGLNSLAPGCNNPPLSSSSLIILPYMPGQEHLCAELIMQQFQKYPKDGEVWIEIPMNGRSSDFDLGHLNLFRPRSRVIPEKAVAAYHSWHTVMTATKFSPYVTVALELCPEDSLERVNHWVSEPVNCVIIPSYLFYYREGAFRLNNTHDFILRKMIQLNRCRVLVRTERCESLIQRFGYVKALRETYERFVPSWSHFASYYLHHTMQPLHQNLTDEEYAVFEGDVGKYDVYQEAIARAMSHLRQKRSSTEEFVVAVLGCGRGPLVDRVLAAAVSVQVTVKVHVVDKNPKLVHLLKRRMQQEWIKSDIILYFGDMREWIPHEALDIVVSEMLGNMGDDECSPECLHAPLKFLKPDGLAIPSSYTSFLSPISSTRLYTELRKRSPGRLQEMMAFSMRQFDFLAISPPKPVLTFSHSLQTNGPVLSSRRTKLSFTSDTDGVLHGFAGYFKAVLFEDVVISTVEGSQTESVASWDPVFFPLTEPVQVNLDTSIQLEFSRRTGPDRVWYEWRLLRPEMTRVHNLGGNHLLFRLTIQEEKEKVVLETI